MSDVPGTAVAVWHPSTRPVGDLALDTAADWPWHAQSLCEARRARLHARAFAVVVAARSTGRVRLESRLCFAERTGPPGAIVLGSHPACDVTNLHGTCLRHALVLGWPDARIDVLDLRTGVGIGVDDARCARVFGSKAVRFSVGDAEVFVAEAAPGEELRLSWGELERRVNGARPTWAPRAHVARQRSHEATSALRESTATRYGLTIALREQQRAVRSDEGGRRIVVTSTIEELERGVVIGRYDRCDVQGPLAGDNNVSRVHAVVVLRDNKLFIVDAASTNGTQVRGAGLREAADLFGAERAHELRAEETIHVCGHRVEIVV